MQGRFEAWWYGKSILHHPVTNSFSGDQVQQAAHKIYFFAL